MKGNSRIYLIVFSASVCSLAFEITLTRIFSISLWYHFAFMAISIAMLGLGLSGTVLSLFPRVRLISRIDIYLILQGISMVFGYLLINQIPFDPVRFQWAKIQFLYIGLYYLILLLPFFFHRTDHSHGIPFPEYQIRNSICSRSLRGRNRISRDIVPAAPSFSGIQPAPARPANFSSIPLAGQKKAESYCRGRNSVPVHSDFLSTGFHENQNFSL